MCSVNENTWDITNSDFLCSELIYIDKAVYPEGEKGEKINLLNIWSLFSSSMKAVV